MKRLLYKITHPFVRLYWKIFKPKTFGARALVLHENNILLVKNINVEKWSLPGGMIDAGEAPEQAVKRELKEELGLNVLAPEYQLGQYLSTKEGKVDTVCVFVIKLLSADFAKQWELQSAAWFPLHNLPDAMSPAAVRRVAEYKEGKRGVVGSW